MARIALVHDLLGGKAGGGGGARAMLDLALDLRDRGHDVITVCHDFLPSDEFEQLSRGLEVRAVRTGVATPATGYRGRFQRHLHGMKLVADLVPDDVDVINGHDWPALHAARLAGKRTGAPVIWTRNDDIEWERTVIPNMTASGGGRISRIPPKLAVGLLDVHDARTADTIVVLSKHDAEMVRRAYGRRAEVIHPGPNRAFFDAEADRGAARRRLGVTDGEFLVLAFALLMPYRRFEDVIDAVAQVSDIPDVRLRLVGSDHINPAYGEALQQRIRERSLEERAGLDRRSVSDSELRDLYTAADLYVFPSARQSYGLAPLEAIALRTPVVVSRGAGVHEVLEGLDGVSVVPPKSPDAIAAAIRQAHTNIDPEGLERTRSRVQTELTSERYAIAMEGLMARAMARRSRRRPAMRRAWPLRAVD